MVYSQSTLDWNFVFFDKNVHEQVSNRNRTSMNVFLNFIRIKLVTSNNDKDSTWMTSNLKDKVNWKNGIYIIKTCNIKLISSIIEREA